MTLQDLPFAVGGLSRLVQDLGGDDELPDVVEEGTPADFVGFGRRQVEFLDDEIGQGPGALAVTPCPAVVGVESGGQGDDLFGQDGDVVGLARLADPLLELADGLVARRATEKREGARSGKTRFSRRSAARGRNRRARRSTRTKARRERAAVMTTRMAVIGRAVARDRPADEDSDDHRHAQGAEKDDRPQDKGGDPAAAPAATSRAPGGGLGGFGHGDSQLDPHRRCAREGPQSRLRLAQTAQWAVQSD